MATEVQAERKRKKIEKALGVLRGTTGEPTVEKENYVPSIIKAINWYNSNEENKTIRKYAISYLKTLGRNDLSKVISESSDFELRQIGMIGRLIMRDQYISDKHLGVIADKIESLKAKYTEVEVITKKVDTNTSSVSIQDRIQQIALKHAGEIDEHIDAFIKNKSSEFSAKGYLLSNSISGAAAKRIGEYFQPLERELAEALRGKDEQLVEGYSYFSKVQLKKFQEFVKGIIDDCNQQVVSAKTSRAPRRRKPVPPTKLVARLKYMKEFPELSIKSIAPTDIIGASELWVYNTKARRISVYKGDLTVKGSSIIGYEIAGTDSKTVRKPEEFFKDLQIGKRPLSAAFKTLTTKSATPNGRINADCILIGAFK
jgi:hypothetical protein